MVEIRRLQARRGLVILAQAGFRLRFRWQAKENLDSGPGSGPGQALRRNDETQGRFRVDEFRAPRLDAEGHSVCLKKRVFFMHITGNLRIVFKRANT